MGECTSPRATLRFDRRVRLEFRGATITCTVPLRMPVERRFGAAQGRGGGGAAVSGRVSGKTT